MELEPHYRTPMALKMAVSSAARNSPLDTGRAVQSFYYHRFLCRVFSEESGFVLKGGHGMLARTTNARATRDLDLLADKHDLDEALGELVRLASKDLSDFIIFELIGVEQIKTQDDYRGGLNVRFSCRLGAANLPPISIDLVVDTVDPSPPETLRPADRLDLPGLPAYDYKVYATVDAVADKVCAMYETHGGLPSSRVKDLVDIVVYLSTTDISGSDLRKRLLLEARLRHIELPGTFILPAGWDPLHRPTFSKLAKTTGLDPSLRSLDGTSHVAAEFLNPVLDGSANGGLWDHELLSWKTDTEIG